MKPLEQRQEYIDYMGGKQMPASSFNSALDIYSDYVYPEVLKEHTTRQLDFDGEVWYRKVRPLQPSLTFEQEHLARPVELVKGVNKII